MRGIPEYAPGAFTSKDFIERIMPQKPPQSTFIPQYPGDVKADFQENLPETIQKISCLSLYGFVILPYICSPAGWKTAEKAP